MKKNTTNKFHDLRKRIISILASNAFKAATLTPLALAMVACKTETDSVTEKEDVITLNNFKINMQNKFKVGETITTKDIGDGVFVDLFINGEKTEEISLKDLFDRYKNTNTFNINVKVTNDKDEGVIYTITNNSFPTQVYELKSEENNFIVSGQFNDVSIDTASLPFTVEPKEQGGSEITNPGGKDPNEGQNPPVTENPETTVKKFNSLEELFEYAGQKISEGDQQTGTITLTAQTIKKLAALPSVLKITIPADTKEEEKETKLKAAALAEYEKYKDLSTLVNAYDKKEIVVEKGEDYKQVEYMDENNYLGILEVPQYKISTLDNNKEIKLNGDFYYTEMIIDASNLNINVDNAKFFMAENHKYKIYVEDLMYLYTKLQDKELNNDNILKGKIDNYKTPSLNFDIAYIDNIGMKDIASLYKIYEKESKLNNIQISYDMQKPVVLDGNENKEDAFLFKGNVLRSELTSEEKSDLPNISVNVLLKLAKLGNSSRDFKNLVITGSYTEEGPDINSYLTNVVFTGDVSGLKNSEEDQFNGVVYFMDKPYNNIKGDSVGPVINGIVKLDKLEGVSYDTFRVNDGVLDLRGRDGLDHNPLKGYNIGTNPKKSINYSGHNAIYFTEKYIYDIEGIDMNPYSIEKTFETLTRRVHRVGQGGSGVLNVYVDNNKYDSIADIITPSLPNYDYHAVSKTPRTLEEFEHYGNNGKYKTPARDSYTEKDFEDLKNTIKEKLEDDKESKANQIVLNNRKIDFIDPETKKIIFSVLNDRQYNA